MAVRSLRRRSRTWSTERLWMKKAEMAITEAPNKAANARFMAEEEGEEDDDDESISGFLCRNYAA